MKIPISIKNKHKLHPKTKWLKGAHPSSTKFKRPPWLSPTKLQIFKISLEARELVSYGIIYILLRNTSILCIVAVYKFVLLLTSITLYQVSHVKIIYFVCFSPDSRLKPRMDGGKHWRISPYAIVGLTGA